MRELALVSIRAAARTQKCAALLRLVAGREDAGGGEQKPLSLRRASRGEDGMGWEGGTSAWRRAHGARAGTLYLAGFLMTGAAEPRPLELRAMRPTRGR
eukprot:scaffold139991_cov35-Tisochrysis_lutea.AAC.1